MKTYLLHHVPKTPNQDTWAVSFSLPYIATGYARAGDGLWYVKTWLTADQISKRLAILFDDASELRIHELGREHAAINPRLQWLAGRLEDDDSADSLSAPMFDGPRAAWSAIQSAVTEIAAPFAQVVRASSSKNLRAA